MEIYKFELTAADRKATLNFELIEKEYQLFTTAAKNCNMGVSFKRDGKQIKIDNITPMCIYLTLTSVSPLPAPKRTLSAFSRELLRLDKEINLLSDSVYNHTLFNTNSIDASKVNIMSIDDISNVKLLKTMVDLLYTSWIEDEDERKKTIDKIKKIILPYMDLSKPSAKE
ncbi:MAG: hypothetical protein NC251_13730 [Lachnoclostridium sp.]|nr:hypothetical protein [Lachnospira sp.]MCM1249466.1 hypothetical protein [Lachnoclostridium sp.]MCM1536266.1 hypothetical protein [Clostridium sp.]